MQNNRHRICLEHNQVETMMGWKKVDDAFEWAMNNKTKVTICDFCPICQKEHEIESEVCYA